MWVGVAPRQRVDPRGAGIVHSLPSRRPDPGPFCCRRGRRGNSPGAALELARYGITLWPQARGSQQCRRPGPIARAPLTTLTRPESQSFKSEEHTSELQSLMRISYAVFCLKTKKTNK